MAMKLIYNASAQKIVVQDGAGQTISEDPTLIGANPSDPNTILVKAVLAVSVPDPIDLND